MSNTGTSIAIIERNMPMERITPLVEALDMDTKRFLSTVLLACERTPKLMNFPVTSHVQWASSAAALGLEPDGVTGQAYPIPFGNKVQLIVGYKGFNTMAGRAGITIHSGVLWEGDRFPTKLVAGEPFWVEAQFGNRAGRTLIGAWAQAQMRNGAWGPMTLLDASEILAVKGRAPGARKSDSPWNDPTVGFPAMAQKTAVRRLQRTLPSDTARHGMLIQATPGRNFQPYAVGAQMDMLHEEAGKHTSVDLDGHLHTEKGPEVSIIDGEATVIDTKMTPAIDLPSGNEVKFGTFENHQTICKKIELSKPETVEAIHELNKPRLAAWANSDNEAARDAAVAITGAIIKASGG